MSYIVTGKEIPQGCVMCTHGKFTESHFLYCEFLMREPKVKISRPDWCPLEERKCGKWIRLSRGDVCSECKYSTGRYAGEFKFCPNCGAKMDEGENDV